MRKWVSLYGFKTCCLLNIVIQHKILIVFAHYYLALEVLWTFTNFLSKVTKWFNFICQDGDESPVYVDANNLGTSQPVMPPLSLTLSVDEVLYTLLYAVSSYFTIILSKRATAVTIMDFIMLSAFIIIEVLHVWFPYRYI